MFTSSLTRRSLLKAGAAGVAAAALPFGVARAANPIVIGAVYVGPRDDFGWNQAHAVAMDVLKQVPGVTVIEEEKVPETDAVTQSMESMINLDQANLILATSFGYYTPFMVEAAKKYPNVQFRHAAPLWKEGDPKNAGSYFCYLNQAHFVNGVAAGLSSKSGKIGFVAAKPIPSVLSNINSVLLGARSVNPNATVQVIFTGEWSLPVREAEASNALIDAGCDVITCHVDGPKVVVETAESRGVKSCGHNASQAPLAPKGFITGAEYKWETIYKIYADALAAGTELPNFIAGGYHNDMLRNTAYGAGATPEAIKAADAAIEGLKAKKPIYVGPLKDNTGKLVIEGTKDNYDPVLDGMNFLLEGVQGSIT
ncbi:MULTISPECIES: BMP family ABC transporter substrate-binding protein [Kaistia]|uniref:BMP family ABC transporter substrate-binding protein n=1 Tax=Kaistia nematophila TaxID=2994654 RepID=A0A9X3IL22_9HYPH|nr:BMP family ABC transporter substrate-binding protein [Kaistia nematophila]MBN9025046.1 BMP family ABC transporter substrate-binding protein [Hyphomicrobiales bacterium]MCX5570214.1 BMP family ABC transporter substrate-binding protein [Kaistia nematophila]